MQKVNAKQNKTNKKQAKYLFIFIYQILNIYLYKLYV